MLPTCFPHSPPRSHPYIFMPEDLILSQTSAFGLPPPFLFFFRWWLMSSGYRSSPCQKWCPTLKELHSPRVRKHCQIISQFFPEIVYCGNVCSKAKYDATISANNVIRMTSFLRRGGWPLLFPRRTENNSHAKVFPLECVSFFMVCVFVYLSALEADRSWGNGNGSRDLGDVSGLRSSPCARGRLVHFSRTP